MDCGTVVSARRTRARRAHGHADLVLGPWFRERSRAGDAQGGGSGDGVDAELRPGHGIAPVLLGSAGVAEFVPNQAVSAAPNGSPRLPHVARSTCLVCPCGVLLSNLGALARLAPFS